MGPCEQSCGQQAFHVIQVCMQPHESFAASWGIIQEVLASTTMSQQRPHSRLQAQHATMPDRPGARIACGGSAHPAGGTS